MACVIAFHSSAFSGGPFLVADAHRLSITEEVGHYSTADVLIAVEPGIRQYLRAVVLEVVNGTDTVLFDGYVHEFRPTREGINLELRDQTAFFERVIVQSDTTVSGTLQEALSALLAPYNARSGANWSAFASTSVSVSKQAKRGDTYFDVFSELAELAGVSWRARAGTVEFGYGEDRSTPVKTVRTSDAWGYRIESDGTFEAWSALLAAAHEKTDGGRPYPEYSGWYWPLTNPYQYIESSGGTDERWITWKVPNPPGSTLERVKVTAVAYDPVLRGMKAQWSTDNASWQDLVFSGNGFNTSEWTVTPTAPDAYVRVLKAGSIDAAYNVAGLVFEYEHSTEIPNDYQEVVYNGRSPQESTIASVETVYGGEVITHLLASDGSSIATAEDPESPFGRIEGYEEFRSGSLAEQAEAHLSRYKVGQRSYKVTPGEGVIVAGAGDIIHLRIENVNEYVDFEGSVAVARKQTDLVGGKLRVSYELGQINAPVGGLTGLLRTLQANDRKAG